MKCTYKESRVGQIVKTLDIKEKEIFRFNDYKKNTYSGANYTRIENDIWVYEYESWQLGIKNYFTMILKASVKIVGVL